MQKIICNAISNKQMLRINYDDKGEREIEPYCLGISKTGKTVLRAYQIIGDSKSGETDGWKLFDVEKINSISEPYSSFSDRPEYNSNDSVMDRIICNI